MLFVFIASSLSGKMLQCGRNHRLDRRLDARPYLKRTRALPSEHAQAVDRGRTSGCGLPHEHGLQRIVHNVGDQHVLV